MCSAAISSFSELHSAEVLSLDAGQRMEGLPALVLWTCVADAFSMTRGESWHTHSDFTPFWSLKRINVDANICIR